jgi:hypothetical protein
MDDAPAPPTAPPAPAASPSTPEPGSPQQGYDAAEARAGRLRLQAKVAGVMMMLFGAFFAFNFALAAYNGPKLAEDYASVPGGNLTVVAPSAAGGQVTLVYRSGAPTTYALLNATGAARLLATNATFTVQVTSHGTSWTRQAFVPVGTAAELRLDPASPAQSDERLGVPTAFYVWFWIPAVAAALLAAGGYFAFKLRGPRLALGGAFLFLLGAGLMASFFGGSLLTISFIGTAVLCFLFVYRARDQFLPLRTRTA